VARFPVALTPSWQEAHTPVMPEWLYFAGLQAVLLWQLEHSWLVVRWLPACPACTRHGNCAITARFQAIESSCRIQPEWCGTPQLSVEATWPTASGVAQRTLRMARCAHSWGTGEHGVDVAGLAGLQTMRASKLESCRQVVKVAPGHLG
jgi:hypothetical protein